MIAAVPRASSVTHAHLLACTNTELLRRGVQEHATVRILDAGCGRGVLMEHLVLGFRALQPSWNVEVYGFDVGDHGVQADGYFEEGLQRLRATVPDHDWSGRVRQCRVGEDWPFEDAFFDVIVSNQVLEHVGDHSHFFRQVDRTLKPGGSSVHLFPLKHCLYEGHLFLPLVHRIRAHDARAEYIAALSRLGFGKYRAVRVESGQSLAEFSEQHSDYMNYWTNYLSEAQLLDTVVESGLRGSFRYTPEFYLQKIRTMSDRPILMEYGGGRRGMRDSVATKLLRYASSITLTAEKINTY